MLDHSRRTLTSWARLYLGDLQHEQRVWEIAQDLVRACSPVLRLTSDQVELLRWGITVHDVGRSIADKGHARLGENLLANASELPLTSAQRRWLRYLIRYHRGPVPDVGRDRILQPSDDIRAVRTVLAILRAADALDNRSTITPPRIKISLREQSLRVECSFGDITSKTLRTLMRKKKFRLLEDVLGCRVQMVVRQNNLLLSR